MSDAPPLSEQPEPIQREVRKGLRLRYAVTVCTAVLVLTAVLFGRYLGDLREKDRAAAERARERDRELLIELRALDCAALIESRAASEAKDVELWSRAADYLEASPEVREAFLLFIHDTYEAMPDPGPCRPVPDE